MTEAPLRPGHLIRLPIRGPVTMRTIEAAARPVPRRSDAETELARLTAATPRAVDPALLDELPYLDVILPTMPPALKASLFAALDLTILWNKTDGQATVTATITDATLAALPLTLGQDGYHDTADPDNIGHLSRPTLSGSMA
jgi:hypothetical protein